MVMLGKHDFFGLGEIARWEGRRDSISLVFFGPSAACGITESCALGSAPACVVLTSHLSPGTSCLILLYLSLLQSLTPFLRSCVLPDPSMSCQSV